jgi:hypothetical protein
MYATFRRLAILFGNEEGDGWAKAGLSVMLGAPLTFVTPHSAVSRRLAELRGGGQVPPMEGSLHQIYTYILDS